MRAISWTAGLVILAVALWIAVSSLFPSDVVTSHYKTMSEAREGHLLARGWLPDILPASSRDIRTVNNLDLNLSDGEFSFKPQDAAGFVSRMQPYKATPAQPESIEPLVAKMRGKGFKSYSFIDGDMFWLFLCKAESGYCEYTMWMAQANKRLESDALKTTRASS